MVEKCTFGHAWMHVSLLVWEVVLHIWVHRQDGFVDVLKCKLRPVRNSSSRNIFAVDDLLSASEYVLDVLESNFLKRFHKVSF